MNLLAPGIGLPTVGTGASRAEPGRERVPFVSTFRAMLASAC